MGDDRDDGGFWCRAAARIAHYAPRGAAVDGTSLAVDRPRGSWFLTCCASRWQFSGRQGVSAADWAAHCTLLRDHRAVGCPGAGGDELTIQPKSALR